MTFKVEDGTGLPDATSYIDVAFADSYFVRTGFTAWAAMDDTAKENALMNATEYADVRWGNRLSGTLLNPTQALQFPRSRLYDRYYRLQRGIPLNWKKAICEYAMQSTKSPLMSDTPSSEAALTKKKVTVGPITTEKEFANPTAKGSFPSYPKADAFVKGYLTGSSGSRVIRN